MKGKWKLEVFKFENGMIIVCDSNGNQVPELQGTEEEAIPKIIKWLKAKLIKEQGKWNINALIRKQ